MGHFETECVTVPFKACPLTFEKEKWRTTQNGKYQHTRELISSQYIYNSHIIGIHNIIC